MDSNPEKQHTMSTNESFDRAFGHMETRLDTIEARLDRQNALMLRMSERLDLLLIMDHRLTQVEIWKTGLWKTVLVTSVSLATLTGAIVGAMIWITRHADKL